MPGRFGGDNSRYGFQDQETDKEIWGGSSFFKYRMNDPRIGRFFAIDPLSPEYPHNSPYAFSENRVTDMIELEGLEAVHPDAAKNTNDVQIKVVDSKTINENYYAEENYVSTYTENLISHEFDGKTTEVTYNQITGFRAPKTKYDFAIKGSIMIGAYDLKVAGEYSMHVRNVVAPPVATMVAG